MIEEGNELESLRALDQQTIRAVHDRYFPELYRYARYRLGDPEAAEDVAAETFTRLLEAIHAGRGPRSSLRGWLMGTAANLVNDHFRQHYVQPTQGMPETLEDHGPGPAEYAEHHEQQQRVREAIRELTVEQQHVIAFRFGAGYSLEQTAALMGKKVNAIKALQFRALAALRRVLEEQEP